MADIIDEASEREEAFRLAAIRRAQGRYVPVQGNKGLCLNCDAPVGEKRLGANPHAILCIDCARDAER